MSTSILAKETRLHLVFGIYVMVFFGLLLQMIIRPPADVRTQIENELSSTVTYLSTSDYQYLENKINVRFQSWAYDSGFYPFFHKAFYPERQAEYAEDWQKGASLGLIDGGWIIRMLENMQLFIYQMVHRITLIEFWFVTMLPMMIAVVMTGYYQWRIKQYQLAGSSTGYVRMYLKLLWIILFLFSVYLITPNIFGAYTIYAPPALLLVVAISVSLVFTNFSKAT